METIIPGPPYRLVTPRLVIRCWQPADAPLMAEAVESSIEHLRPWMPWAAEEPKPLQTRIEIIRRWRAAYDRSEDFVMGIFERDESRALGGTGLHTRVGHNALEIGYWVRVDAINRGIATEVAAVLTRAVFECFHKTSVEIHCDPANARSAAVPKKLGYTLDGVTRAKLPTGERDDSLVWTLLDEDYPASPAAAYQYEAYDAAERRMV